MTLQLIIAAYLILILGIVYLSRNHIFKSNSSEIDHNNSIERSNDITNFEGKKVVFDGEMDKMKESFIKKDLKRHNASIEDKMSLETNLLITGKNPDWLVVEEAKQNGIKIVNEIDWQRSTKVLYPDFTHKATNKSRKNTKTDSVVV